MKQLTKINLDTIEKQFIAMIKKANDEKVALENALEDKKAQIEMLELAKEETCKKEVK